MICVDHAATLIGTLGGGCVEADVRRKAHQQLSGANGYLVTFDLDNDFGDANGMICGGQMDVAICPIQPCDNIEPLRKAVAAPAEACSRIPIRIVNDGKRVMYRVCVEASPTLLIAGAGHISRVLSGFALEVGFDVHVIDDRADYANDRRFPSPIQIHVGDIATTLERWQLNTNTYVVIVTRGHNHDEAALRAVLGRPARYVGMIGSRRKIEVVFQDLRRTGAKDDELGSISAPIGLDINAVTTEEIAVSIVAQLVKVRRRTSDVIVEGPFPDSQET